MKAILGVLTLLSFLSVFPSCTRIDAGHTGIIVELYSSTKGVQDVTESTGMIWYNPFTTDVQEWPLYVQNALYTADQREESPDNEEFRITTKDGLVASFDVSLNYRLDPSKVPAIFKKYRKAPDILSKTVLRNYMRDGFNRAASTYTAEQLYENRTRFQNEADHHIRNLLQTEGFIVEQVVLLNEIRLPASVVQNINDKVNAIQIANKKGQEVLQQKYEADKKIEIARGDSARIIITAKAQAKANELVNSTLTQQLIQNKFIDVWDGKLPVYGQVPQLFKNITGN